MASTTSALLFSYGHVPAMNHLSVWLAVAAVVLIATLFAARPPRRTTPVAVRREAHPIMEPRPPGIHLSQTPAVDGSGHHGASSHTRD